MSPRPLIVAVAIATISGDALAVDGPSSESPPPPAWRKRAANFRRAGSFVVDGRFARPQAVLKVDDLFAFTAADRIGLLAQPSASVEPLLKNYRVSLVRLEGSDFGFKLSCVGRVWDDRKAGGTQNLVLVAVPDGLIADETMRLTKIEITPQQAVVQAVVMENGDPTSVIVVFGRDFIEAAVGLFEKPPTVLIRSRDARELYRERPVEVRRYVVPLLRLLNRGQNPLAPAAGDVYRVFADLPVDSKTAAAVSAQLTELSAADPAVRRRANEALRNLGPRGVQAAMRLDRSRLPIEAAERIATWIDESTRDPRPADALRADPNFLLDCLTDADANVRTAAGALVGK